MPDQPTESLVSRLRGLKREAEDGYGLLGNTRANTLHEAANHIEELEAALSERSLLVEENERLRRVLALAEHRLRDEGMWLLHGSHDERAKVVAGWVDHLRSLTVSQEGECERCGGEQIIAVDIPGGHARTVQPCPDCKDQGDGEVAVRLSLTADEQAALRHEFSEPYGRDMRLGIIGKLRTALEEEGR